MSELQSKDQADLMSALAKAWADTGTVDPTGHPLPDVDGAYAIQAALFQRGGHALKGFKLSLREGKAYSAPLLFVEGGSDYRFEPGIFVEAELALTLSRDLPAREQAYTRADILAAVGKLSLGVEIARSRFSAPPSWPLGLSDFLSNVGYLVGIDLDRALLEAGADLGQVLVQADAIDLFNGPAKHPDNDPLASLVAYANGTPGPLGTLKAGQVITTGSLCGAIRIAAPCAVRIAIGDASYEFTLSFKQ